MSQSYGFCRPKKLQYVKETKDIILAEKQALEDEIKNLQIHDIVLENGHIRIHFRLSAKCLTGTKLMQFYPICHATPKQFNNIMNIKEGKFIPIKTSLEYGISPLHAWIKLLELCSHLSYRFPIKKWQIKTPKDKKICSERKIKIQIKLWEKLSIKVDMPEPGGCGNSNNENIGRRAFKDPDSLSRTISRSQSTTTEKFRNHFNCLIVFLLY